MEVYGGTAGWSYADWHGPFYPERKEKGFSELKFYADFFDCVEVNSTYYRHFPPSTAEKWLTEVKKNPKFIFLVKLFKEFTHGSRERGKEFIENRNTVMEFLSPFMDQKKLGGVLVQFSEYYRDSVQSQEYIALIRDAFNDYPLFFELRHTSWYTARAKEFLKQNDINVIAIDQPQLKGMIGFDSELFGKVAYVRLHGRNSEMWDLGRKALAEGMEAEGADRNARYNYLYSSPELDELEEKLRRAKEHCTNMYLVLNNHPLGKAVVNALELIRRMRDMEKISVPDTTLKYFPELGKIANKV